jgi:hypothetical protein
MMSRPFLIWATMQGLQEACRQERRRASPPMSGGEIFIARQAMPDRRRKGSIRARSALK